MQRSPIGRAKLFFFISGCTALVYEIVWLRLLGLVFGNTTYAVSTVLSAYMAGLGLGSFFLGRAAERWARPLRVYGLLEIGVGLYAALTPLLLWLIRSIYVSFGGAAPDHPGSIALKLLLSFLIVFVPTFFMGGTLPVLIKYFFREEKSAGSVTGLLYGLNTAGALTGTLLGGFWLLPQLGVNGTLAVSVILNLAIGALAMLLSVEFESTPAPAVPKTAPRSIVKIPWVLPAGLFVSGVNAMLYEVGWTRILATVLSSSTYAFTMMLASFLLGIALGSWACKRYLAKREATGLAWGWLQLTIAASSLAALPLFPWVSLFVVRLYGLSIGHPHLLLFLMCLLCVTFMIVPAFCFGALFPLSSALFIAGREEASKKIGTLYLWNTLGNIVGSLGAGFLLIPFFGIEKTLITAITCGAALSAFTSWAVAKRPMRNSLMFVASLGVLVGAGTAAEYGWDKRLVSSGLNIDARQSVGLRAERILAKLFNHRILYYREGLNGIVAVGQEGENRYLKVNGKTDATTLGDVSTQLLFGHLPHLLHPKPDRSLVIGYGSGMTLEAVLMHPVKSVDCVEIEPAVMEAAPFFKEVNMNTLTDPRAKILINDGRNHLLMEKGKYDVIVSEPSNPWMAGISFLFTTDFYKLVESKLNPGGIFCQWIQAYSIRPEDFWMVVASVREIFPNVTLWRTTEEDYLIIAQREPFRFDLDGIQARIDASEPAKKQLKGLEIEGAAGLLPRFQFGEATVAKLIEQASLNTDNFLPLEFSTPLSLYDPTGDLKEDIDRMADKEPLPPIDTSGEPIERRPEILAQIGKGYLGMNDFGRARKYFEAAGDHPDALTGLARCLIAEGSGLKGMALYEKAATAESLDFLGRYFMSQHEPERALEALERSLSIETSQWETHFWKGQALEALAKPNEAQAAYEAARALLGPRLGIRLAVARTKRLAGKTGEALVDLEQLQKEFPTHYPIYIELRSCYLSQDKLDPLIEHYEKLVEMNPYFKNYWVDLIGLYIKKGDNENLQWTLERSANQDLY